MGSTGRGTLQRFGIEGFVIDAVELGKGGALLWCISEQQRIIMSLHVLRAFRGEQRATGQCFGEKQRVDDCIIGLQPQRL
mmetsp:Transcript_69687/g.134406  ORF Transcript_69687/g.134406 Transcript_69687/m.134406 type:complete len:80 (+) Transcript_69687:566-805(+)